MPTPLTPIRQPLQVLPAKIGSDPVNSLLNIFSHAEAADKHVEVVSNMNVTCNNTKQLNPKLQQETGVIVVSLSNDFPFQRSTS